MKISGLVVTLIALSASKAVSAQDALSHADSLVTLSGVVRDINGQPLRAAEVIAGLELRTVTDNKGEFTLPGLARGSISVLIRRIGYKPANFGLQTEPDVNGVKIAATLSPAIVELRTVVVEGKKMDLDLWQNGFYARERRGGGVFFSPERLDRTAASVSTLMQEVPSVQVSGDRGIRIPVARNPDGLSYCVMNVVLDGTLLPWAGEVGIDHVIGRDDVKAIEVYNRSSMIPNVIKGPGLAQASAGYAAAGGNLIGGSFKECGAIMIWSKFAPRPNTATGSK